MVQQGNAEPTSEQVDVLAAREVFRSSLVRAHKARERIGDVEAAAAQFCQALRRHGHSPERMLIEAKQVIEGAIDDENRPLAEKAVTSCIQHYYRA